MARKPRRPQRRSQGRKNSAGAAARRKDAIDRGLTGDKVPGFDPAAAPLGTDAEAAGAPPDSVQPPIPEGARADPDGLAADPRGTDRRRYRIQDRLVWPAIVVAVLVAAAVFIAVLFAWG